MQHTAHQAIATRLNMWRVFFTTGVGTIPLGVTGCEYDIDHLIALALESEQLHLVDLAELVDLMVKNHTRRQDLDTFDALMQDEDDTVPVRMAPPCVTMEELDAALVGA